LITRKIFKSRSPENVRIVLVINELQCDVTELLSLCHDQRDSLLVGRPELDLVIITKSMASKRIIFHIQLVLGVQWSERESAHSRLSSIKVKITLKVFLLSVLRAA
jgi:hypothetical protein